MKWVHPYSIKIKYTLPINKCYLVITWAVIVCGMSKPIKEIEKVDAESPYLYCILMVSYDCNANS
jgi:hypothetical protein